MDTIRRLVVNDVCSEREKASNMQIKSKRKHNDAMKYKIENYFP